MILYSISILLICPSYLLVTVPQLRKRLLKMVVCSCGGRPGTVLPGKWGLP